jgi:hypothetical protein
VCESSVPGHLRLHQSAVFVAIAVCISQQWPVTDEVGAVSDRSVRFAARSFVPVPPVCPLLAVGRARVRPVGDSEGACTRRSLPQSFSRECGAPVGCSNFWSVETYRSECIAKQSWTQFLASQIRMFWWSGFNNRGVFSNLVSAGPRQSPGCNRNPLKIIVSVDSYTPRAPQGQKRVLPEDSYTL